MKRGQKVICVYAESGRHLRYGQEYTVRSVVERGTQISLKEIHKHWQGTKFWPTFYTVHFISPIKFKRMGEKA